MKVRFIIPNLAGGGAERALVNLYKGLKNYEIYDLYVVLFQNLKKYDEILNEDLIILNTTGSRNPLGKIKNFFKRIYLLSLIKKKISPDLSISFLEGADFLNLLTKNKNHKVIIVIHSYMTKLFKEDYNDGIIKKILRKVYSYSRKI